MGKISCLFILFCTFFLFAAAQNIVRPDTIRFDGVVLNEATGDPLTDVTCLYGKKGAITGASGGFALHVAPGDTVRFSYVGFRPYIFAVPDTLYKSEYIMAVFLVSDTVALSEALVLQRFENTKMRNLMNLRNNMAGIIKSAYDPNRPMDADMNQRMLVDEFARGIEMKGMVDVRLGVGTHSLEALKNLKLYKKIENQDAFLETDEVNLLKKIYYVEKKEKRNE